MGSADPLEQSVKQTLVAYQAETDKLHVHLIDPDRDTAALEDVRKRFRIETGRTEDGHVVTDAVMVASQGRQALVRRARATWCRSRRASRDEARAKPREEQAITLAIRNVLGGDKAKLCFTAGHGELELADASEEGLAFLADILQKDNYETATVDTSAPDAHDPFKGCAVVLIAGPRGPFTKEEANRLRTYLMEGGSLYLALSPLNAQTESGMVPAGLDDALSPFGIALDDDLVFELDPKVALPESRGIRFFATAKEHPVTAGLVHDDAVPREVPARHDQLLALAPPRVAPRREPRDRAPFDQRQGVRGDEHRRRRGLDRHPGQEAARSRPVRSCWRWRASVPSSRRARRTVRARWSSGPAARSFAATGPSRSRSGGRRSSPRAPSPGSPRSRPSSTFRPRPASPPGSGSPRTRASEVKRYVLVFMPLAAILLGLAVGLRRRGTEGGPRKSAGGKERPKDRKEHA